MKTETKDKIVVETSFHAPDGSASFCVIIPCLLIEQDRDSIWMRDGHEALNEQLRPHGLRARTWSSYHDIINRRWRIQGRAESINELGPQKPETK